MAGVTICPGPLTGDPLAQDQAAKVFPLWQTSGGSPTAAVIGYNSTTGNTEYRVVNQTTGATIASGTVLASANIFAHGGFCRLRVAEGTNSTSAALDVVCCFYMSSNHIHEICVQFVAPSTVNVVTASALTTGFGFSLYTFLDGVYDSAHTCWHIVMAYTGSVSTPAVSLLAVTDVLTFSTGTLTTVTNSTGSFDGLNVVINLAPASGGLLGMRIHHYVSGSVLSVVSLTASNQMIINPINILGPGSYNYVQSPAESPLVVGGPVDFGSWLNPANGNLTLAPVVPPWANYTSRLLVMHRFGPNTYTTPQTVAWNVTGGNPANNGLINPAFAYDLNTQDLYLAFVNYSSQANGEIWLSKRPAGGTWNQPFTLAGNDATGYQYPSVAETFSSAASPPQGDAVNIDLVLVQGTSAPTLQWLTEAAVTPPQTPTVLSPVGATIASSMASIPVSGTYNTANPQDPMGTIRIQCIDPSGPTTVYDSGTVSASTVSGTIGATLTAGHTYTLTVTVGDSDGGGTASTTVSFTPYHQPTLAISTVVEGPSSSGATVGSGGTCHSAIVDITVSPTDAESLTMIYYQQILIAADDLTPAFVGPKTACSVGTGGTATLADFQYFTGASPALVNDGAHTYYLQVRGWWQGTGGQIQAYTANFPFMPLVAVPTAVSGLAVVPNPLTGQTGISWTNPVDATVVGIVASCRVTGTSAWVQLASYGASLPTALTHLEPLSVAYDYQVQTVNALGMLSSPQIVSGVTLTEQYGMYGYWFVSVSNPALGFACGMGDLNDMPQSFLTQINQNAVPVVSPGKDLPTMDINPVAYGTMANFKVAVPVSAGDGTHITKGWDVIQTALQISKAGGIVQVRDWMGNFQYGKITAPQWNPLDNANFNLLFAWTQLYYSGPSHVAF